ncbi:hypothetical protein [Flavobacterium sp. GCM10027622]|uniref:hypothetical protein n=1 Tax=unclassified Flavobacterium TaxID=196869 RepID=UPI003608F4C1
MKVLGTVMILIFLVSCNNNSENKKNLELSPVKSKESLNNKVVSADSLVVKTEIINNEFANAPLGEFDFFDKNLSSFFKGTYDVHKTTTVNKYTDGIDTLITFQKRNSSARFYKTNEKVMLDSLNVSDKSFVTLKFGVDIGMNKDEVLNLFKVNKKDSFSDTISIVDDEGSSSVQFIFVDKKLKKMLILPW